MAKNDQPFENLSETAAQSVEQNMEKARGAMDSYFDYFQNAWGHTELIEKMRTYTEQNIFATVECVHKLSQAKDFQDAARIQTEFMQTQWHSFGEQAKSLGETYIKKQRLQ